jgi:retinol-binding protein 3
MRLNNLAAVSVLIVALAASPSFADSIAPDARAAVCDSLARTLDGYVYADMGEKMKAEVVRRRSDYLQMSDPEALAAAMTADLRAVSNDKHLNVMYPKILPTEAPSAQAQAADAARAALSAYGFGDVRRLPGNIGYFELRSFPDGPEVAAYADAVMRLVGHTSALIIDLRRNHGGLTPLTDLLTGYLLGRRELLIIGHTRQPGGGYDTEKRYSIPPPDGRAYDKPIYILTSHGTFSEGEEFTYDLQSLDRATVIGETTGGGANSGDVIPLAANFAVFIPTSYVEGAATHKSWEGTGVQPNVPTAAAMALVEAYKEALTGTRAASLSEQERKTLDAALADPEATLKSAVQF